MIECIALCIISSCVEIRIAMETLQQLTVLIGLYLITVTGADVSSCLLNDPCTASGAGNCQCESM